MSAATTPGPCTAGCGRIVRPHHTSIEQHPATLSDSGRGVCWPCRKAKKREVPPSDDPSVVVRVMLRPKTYRAWLERARSVGSDVGVALSIAADNAIKGES